jgi:hypothetical protein
MKKNIDPNFFPREKAPTISMGLRFSVGEDFFIIDFLDMPGNEMTKVSSSVAVTKKQAKDLIKELQAFIDEG